MCQLSTPRRKVFADESTHTDGPRLGTCGSIPAARPVANPRSARRGRWVLLTAGNVNDTLMFAPLATGSCCPATGVAHTIPRAPRPAGHNRRRRGSHGGRAVGFDKARYWRRNVVERSFCQLKHWAGAGHPLRHDRHANNYLGGLTLAALLTGVP